jgi:TetR/AcrR family transcriptional regulator
MLPHATARVAAPEMKRRRVMCGRLIAVTPLPNGPVPDGVRDLLATDSPDAKLYYRVIIGVDFDAMQGKSRAGTVRLRRSRSDIREELLQSALIEFGAKGYDGASTRAIARRVEAHQPQINYHFESKTSLWMAAVDYLFGLLGEALDGAIPLEPTGVDVAQVASAFAGGIRRFVDFVAEHPELNQIMVHEGTAASERLTWMTETHVKPLFDGIRPAWQMLRNSGVAVAIDHEILYYVLVGAASLPYVNAPEVRQLTGRNPEDPEWIDAHAAALIAILLPGLSAILD